MRLLPRDQMAKTADATVPGKSSVHAAVFIGNISAAALSTLATRAKPTIGERTSRAGRVLDSAKVRPLPSVPKRTRNPTPNPTNRAVSIMAR